MKKKIIGGIAVFAIAAVAALNVNMVQKDNKTYDITLSKIEASAGFWDDVEQTVQNVLQGQGLTKDEEKLKEPCSTKEYDGGSGSFFGGNETLGGSASGSGSHYQENPSTRHDIRCGSGYENCSEVDC